MMDDFGDFLQASPALGPSPPKPATAMNQSIDLNSKILSSFDLSGSSQKATFKFHQPSKHVGKRPHGAQVKQSSSSADWKNLNLDVNEFITPATVPQNTHAVQCGQSAVSVLHHSQFNIPQQPELIPTMQSNPTSLSTSVPLSGHYSQHAAGPIMPGLADWQASTPPMSGNTFYSGNVMPPSYQSATLQCDPLNSATNSYASGLHPNSMNLVPPINSLNGKPISLLDQNRDHQKVTSVPRGNALPSWMTNPDQIPLLYKQVLKHCATTNSFADTNLLYPIFLSSELPKDILGHIWTASNQSTPGQLTYTEVYTALALIALAQKGEMDLSVRYVLKLPSAPIPKIEVPQETRSNCLNLTSGTKANSQYRGLEISNQMIKPISHYTDFKPKETATPASNNFTQFQSFSSAKTSSNSGLEDFTDFQSFESFGNASTGLFNPSNALSYPNRDLLNSPKSAAGPSLLSRDPPKNLLGNIDFQKFNDDSSSKVLHSAAKQLNVPRKSTEKGSLVPAHRKDDEFDDFKSAVELPKAKEFSGISPSFANLTNTSTNAIYSPCVNDKYAALKEINKGSTKGPVPNSSEQADDSDKYSALRWVEPTTETSNIVDPFNEDFADFQSVPQSQSPAPEPSQVRFNPVGDAFGKNFVSISDDIQSVNSLELPSLSRTILNNSIGTTNMADSSQMSPFPFIEKSDSLQSPSNGNMLIAGGLKRGVTMHSDIPVHKTGNDDGLYDLDDPISPVAQRKPVIVPTVQSPPKTKRVPVRSTISESDDDFGDFSTGPPPIDDELDQHNFDPEEGDSSLVNFDAFGHFEEAKVEMQKKKEATFKRSKEDATAFSEFVKSSVIDMKPAHSNENCTSTSKSEHSHDIEEDSSIVETDSKMDHSVDSTQSFQASFSVKEVNDNSMHNSWKLEPMYSEIKPDINLKVASSVLEEEGNEMKARIAGDSNPMEIFVDHWSRCLLTCKDIIVSTGEIFAALNSPSVCHEVVNSTRGKEFISCTSEVYGVARRIRKGMDTVGLHDADLSLSLKEIEIAWNNLLGFCPYTPSVHKTPEHKLSTTAEKSLCSACSLCLLDTESTEVSGLEYCGRFYHAPCANLWLNQIAPILPRLEITTK